MADYHFRSNHNHVYYNGFFARAGAAVAKDLNENFTVGKIVGKS